MVSLRRIVVFTLLLSLLGAGSALARAMAGALAEALKRL
jgi:hypothetical protein